MDPVVRFRRRVSRNGKTATEWLATRVTAGTSLLDVAQTHGLPVARACRGEALCSRCGFQILSGEPSLSSESDMERDIKRRNRIPASDRLACQARILGDVDATTGYW